MIIGVLPVSTKHNFPISRLRICTRLPRSITGFSAIVIQHSHRLDNFFMNFHHFMRMHKATRINENMPRNRPHPHIFLNRKSHNARLSEIFSIRKHVSSYRSNRFFINIKCIKTKFHHAFFKIFVDKSKNLTDSKFFLPDFKVF